MGGDAGGRSGTQVRCSDAIAVAAVKLHKQRDGRCSAVYAPYWYWLRWRSEDIYFAERLQIGELYLRSSGLTRCESYDAITAPRRQIPYSVLRTHGT